MPLIGFDLPDFLVIFFQNINKFNFMMIDMSDFLTDKFDLRPISTVSKDPNFDIIDIFEKFKNFENQ